MPVELNATANPIAYVYPLLATISSRLPVNEVLPSPFQDMCRKPPLRSLCKGTGTCNNNKRTKAGKRAMQRERFWSIPRKRCHLEGNVNISPLVQDSADRSELEKEA